MTVIILLDPMNHSTVRSFLLMARRTVNAAVMGHTF